MNDAVKIKTGIGAADIIAIVFIVLGGAFAGGALMRGGNISELEAHGTGDVKVLPLVFGGIGTPFLIVGLACAVWAVRRRIAIRKVVAAGDYVTAKVVSVRQNFNVQVSGRCPFVVECHYQDPVTGVLHVFHSCNLYYYPEELMGNEIRVYVDPKNMKHYYVDTCSLNQDVQIHN